MPKQILLDVTVRNAKPGDKVKRLNDGSGLHLLIKPDGAKWWRFDYSANDKRKTLSLGVYPVIGLADARRKAEDARKLISLGIDPSSSRKAAKNDKRLAAENAKRVDDGLPILNSFEHVARNWLAANVHTVKPITHNKKIQRFHLHVFPAIGRMAINEIKSPDIFSLVKPLFNKLETGHRVHAEISAVFSYAIAHGLTDYDPAQAVGAQIPAKKVKHRAALTEPKDVAQLLRDIACYQGTFVVQCAFRISPLLFQRPGEIRQMEWKDIDLNAKEWRYFVTKTEVEHIVPLSTQAITILEEIKPLTGSVRYVFPSCRNDGRPMSDNTIRTALRTLGYDAEAMSPHGFRTTASTLLNEQGWSPDAIERQLCHMPKDAVRAAYNRAQYLDERRRMMQSWADYLDGLKLGAQVIPIRKPA
ncbi:MAG: integrase arm-type DNA-binding domain-containing protein [Methylococcaceae bacterium]